MSGWTKKLLYAACAVTFLSSAPIGCANGDDTTIEEPGDSKHDSFLVDGKADAFGVTEGSVKALGVLELANTASLTVLDDDVALDVRAATNIVDTREQEGRLDTLEELDAVSWVGPRAFRKLYDYALSNGYIKDGSQPTGEVIHGVAENSPEADAILDLVNAATLSVLDDDVALDVRAANNIVEHRELSTIDSLTELDSISYVGARAFGRLLQYVTVNDLIEDDDPTAPRPGESTDPFSEDFCLGDSITDAQVKKQFDFGASNAALGEARWNVRNRVCNDVTGCGAWSDAGSITAKVKLKTNGSGDVVLDVEKTPHNGETNVYDSNTVTSTDLTVRSLKNTYNTYDSRYYRGKMTDHCLRLTETRESDKDSSSSWIETHSVMTHRFDPDPGKRDTPPAEAAPDSPFHDASCEGSTITQQQATAHFPFGEHRVNIGDGEWRVRNRKCNEVSGCGEWSDAGSFTETAFLETNGSSNIILDIDKTPHNGETNVYDSNAVTSDQLTVRSLKNTYNTYDSRYYRGKMTDHCLRLTETRNSDQDSTSSWIETHSVYSLDVDPDPTARDNAPDETPTDSVFHADSCPGSTVSQSEAASFFDPGSSVTSIGEGAWHRRQRQCNERTGCGEWEVVGSPMNTPAKLRVNSSSQIVLDLDETLHSGETNVYNSNPVTSDQLTVRSLKNTYNTYDSRYYRGHMTASCIFLSETYESDPDASDSYVETQEVYAHAL